VRHPAFLLRSRQCLAVLAFGGVLLSSADAPRGESAPSQDPQRPTFRLDANFVRVDIYPTADGRPVTDLAAADFEVLEDGVPQQIETFEYIRIAGSTPVEQRRDPNNVAQMRAEAENPRARVFVIFLDTGLTEVDGSHRMQRPLVNMLDGMLGPDDLFAVMTPQMSPSDLAFARKTETVEGYLRRYWTWGQRDRMMPEDPVERRYTECYPPGPGQIISSLAQALIDLRREKFSLDALEDVSIYLRGVREERKAVIAVTTGWLLSRENPSLMAGSKPRIPQLGTTPEGRLTTDQMKSDYGYSIDDCERDRQTLSSVDFFQEFRDLIDVANRGNVSIYPFDSRGLAASDSSAGFSQRSPAAEIALVRRRVEGLRTIAAETDGIAIVETNDFNRGAERIVADMSSYYLVGYYSKNPKLDGRYRKISVKVKRSGVEVRARRGYKAATAAELAPAATAAKPSGPAPGVQAAITALAAMRPAALHTSVGFMRGGIHGVGPMRLWATVELDAAAAKGDFARGCDIAVAAAAADGTMLGQGRTTLVPGTRTAVIDLGEVSGTGDLVVRTRAKPSGDGAAVTDTKVVAGDAAAAPVLWRRGPSTAMKFVPTADVRFTRADRVRAEVVIADAGDSITATLLDRAGGVINLPVTTGTRVEGAANWGTAELALAPLAAGDYVLKIALAGSTGPSDVYMGIRVVQ
jgi:VWFA-related protein